MARSEKRGLLSSKAAITDRMRSAVLSFKTRHDLLQEARASTRTMSAADAEAFWAGPGDSIQQNAYAAAASAATAYKAYVAAGLAGGVSDSDRVLVIAANRYLGQEAQRLGKPNEKQNVSD